MPIVDTVRDWFRHEAEHLECVILRNDHISPAVAPANPLSAGCGYFRVWVVQMFLARDRDWFKSWYPVVRANTTVHFGNLAAPTEIAHIAGPGQLSQVDPAHLGRVVQLDHALTPLVPFAGGDVVVEAGLVAIQASDMVQRFLDAVGGFAQLMAVPQLSSAIGIAGAVANGINSLMGLKDKELKLGYQATMVGAGSGGSNELRPFHVVLFNAPSGAIPDDELWLLNGTVGRGNVAATAGPVTGLDYMVLRVETRTERDDWASLAAINDPWTRAIASLSEVDSSGQPKAAEADVLVRVAAVAALNSPDLTENDRLRIARAIWKRFADYKGSLGLDGGSRSTLAVEVPPTLADVARTAREIDASPISIGDLI